MESSKPSLSIIIVNYKSCKLITDCIASIQQQTTTLSYELIVVDNHSEDDSEAILTRRFPGLRYHPMGYNSGFARANNEGMRLAKAETFLLLNPDTIILNQAIEQCYHAFANDQQYIACGVQLLESDGRPQISGSYNMKGGINTLLPLPYWGKFLRWIGYRIGSKMPSVPEIKHQLEVDWINGAFLMVRRDAAFRSGLMDESFFLYSEEIEWCSRLKRAGRLCVYGQFNVIHLQGAAANTAFNSPDKGYYNLYDKKGLQIMTSSFLRVRKQFGLFWFLFMLCNYVFAIPVSFWGAFFSKLFQPRKIVSEWKTLGGFYKNMSVFLWRYMFPILVNARKFYKVL